MQAPTLMDNPIFGLAALIIAAFSLLTTAILAIRQSRLLVRYRLLLQTPSGRDLEQLLLEQGSRIDQAHAELIKHAERLDQHDRNALYDLQRCGVVRFCAFPDTGSDLSFAIALLDAHNNGVVISSLYGRNESRVYAKPINDGKSTYTLTDEEKEAISKAVQGRNG